MVHCHSHFPLRPCHPTRSQVWRVPSAPWLGTKPWVHPLERNLGPCKEHKLLRLRQSAGADTANHWVQQHTSCTPPIPVRPQLSMLQRVVPHGNLVPMVPLGNTSQHLQPCCGHLVWGRTDLENLALGSCQSIRVVSTCYIGCRPCLSISVTMPVL